MCLKWGIIGKNNLYLHIPKIIRDGSTKLYLREDDKNSADIFFVKNEVNNLDQVLRLIVDLKKHIICEPPMTTINEDFKTLAKINHQNNKMFILGIFSRYYPVYQRLQHELKLGKVGKINVVNINISPLIDKMFCSKRHSKFVDMTNIALQRMLTYGLQLCQIVYDTTPSDIISKSQENLFTFKLIYPEDKYAYINLSTHIHYPNDAFICGSNGIIKIYDPFWSPLKMSINDIKYEYPLLFEDTIENQGFYYMAQEITSCIQGGVLESPWMTHQDSIDLIENVKRCRDSLNNVD